MNQWESEIPMNYTIYLNAKKLNSNDLAAIQEYSKRLQAYCKTHFLLKPASGCRAIMSAHKSSNHTCFIQVQTGSHTPSSEELSDTINQLGIQGISNICFFIGYSSDDISDLTVSYKTLSLSSMDLSIGLTGVVLFEQLYRSYRILNHQPYHK